jgi:hypothetical protein
MTAWIRRSPYGTGLRVVRYERSTKLFTAFLALTAAHLPQEAHQVRQILNPKLTILFFAFLPQFVQPGSTNAVARMLGLSAVFMLATLVVFALYGAFAAGMRHHVVSRPRVVIWMRRLFAGTYAALAGRLALSS